MVKLNTANGSSSSVPAAVGPGTHRQGWGTSESVSLAASQASRDRASMCCTVRYISRRVLVRARASRCSLAVTAV